MEENKDNENKESEKHINKRIKKEKSELDLQIDRFCKYIRKHPEIFEKENLIKLIEQCEKKKEEMPKEEEKKEEEKKEEKKEIKQAIIIEKKNRKKNNK